MPKKETVLFLEKITSLAKPLEHRTAFEYNIREICDYLESLPVKTRVAIFTDKYWNRYPKFVWWKKHSLDNLKSHAKALREVTECLDMNKDKYPKTYNSVVKHSCGIILNYAIEYFSGSIKRSLINRGLESDDVRVVKVSAKYADINKLPKLINHKDYGVRTIVSNRISPVARPDLFLKSQSHWTRILAINSADLDKQNVISMIDSRSSNIDWIASKEIQALLNKLSNNDILYFINLTKNLDISKYFRQRIS